MRNKRGLVFTGIITLFLILTPMWAQSASINDLFFQIETDFATFDVLQEEYLINYPETGHYFQGIASPGFYGDNRITHVPVGGIARPFNPSLKPSDRDEDWSDFGFTGDANGEVIAQYSIGEWMAPNSSIGYVKIAKFGWRGYYYYMIEDQQGGPYGGEKFVELYGRQPPPFEEFVPYRYDYLCPGLLTSEEIPEGYEYIIPDDYTPPEPDICGHITLKGLCLVDRKVVLRQWREWPQRTITDENGYFEFESVVPDKRFLVIINGPKVSD